MDAPHAKAEEIDALPVATGEGPLLERYRQAKNDPDRQAREAQWLKDNASTIAAYNEWFESKGHTYLRHPRF